MSGEGGVTLVAPLFAFRTDRFKVGSVVDAKA